MIIYEQGEQNKVKCRIVIKSFSTNIEDLLIGEEYIYWEEYLVQVKKWYGWVTIKSFSILDNEDLALIEAEELFDAIINPNKIK